MLLMMVAEYPSSIEIRRLVDRQPRQLQRRPSKTHLIKIKYEGEIFGHTVKYKRYVLEDNSKGNSLLSIFDNISDGVFIVKDFQIEMYKISSTGLSKSLIFNKK